MEKIVVILLLILIAILVFCISQIILIKKSVVYKYLEKDKELTSFDYSMDYDGNWLFKKVDFESLFNKTKDPQVIAQQQRIKTFQKLSVVLSVIIVVVIIVFKLSETV
ncbi:hypothetical protein [Flavobacterium nitrogenifigens]|uniref:hypothetical protein n=1 Tax=Flavobacterium nitrogenifigens TaxID=1617283 RepID=UPI0031AF75A5